jgi:4-hydroxy-tetrahydrodipicolinate reductase
MQELRVAVWGLGQIGQACVRMMQRRPEYRVVGALVYDAAKDGRDIGDIAGIDPMGVAATADRAAFLALDADCVLYTARAHLDWSNDDDVLELLASGRNVVTSIPWKFLSHRGPDVVERFRVACERGGSTFYVGGVDPDLVSERVLLALSAGCTEIERITLREYFRLDTTGTDVSAVFGGSMEESEGTAQFLAEVTVPYCEPTIRYIADKMGRPVDSVRSRGVAHPTPAAIDVNGVKAAPGTVGMVQSIHEGFSQGQLFFSIELFYFASEAMRPFGTQVDESWELEIEGRPSFRLKVDSLASVAGGTLRYPDDPTPPGAYVTAGVLVQAIGAVVAAEPGVAEELATHWSATPA